jgi:hypothetical protein
MTFLARADVQRLTKCTRYAAQRRALDALGVRYTVVADGEPLVPAATVDGSPAQAQHRAPKWHRISA